MHTIVYINNRPVNGYWMTPRPYWTELGGCSITGAGTKLSIGQIQALLRQAGWPDVIVQDSDGDSNPLIVIMSAVCLSESGGYSGAENHCGENSIGLFQINLDAWSSKWTREQLLDPLTNAQAALFIYQAQGLNAWGPYSSGIYSANMPAAWAAYGGGSAPSNSAIADLGGLAIGTETAAVLGGLFLLALLMD